MKSENDSSYYIDVYQSILLNDSTKAANSPKENTQSGNNPEPITFSPYGKCLIDHSGRQFACLHDQCMEHEGCYKNEAVEGIFDFQALHFHAEDQALFCEKIFPDILKFMMQVPADERSGYRLSFNHRYTRKDGTTSQFLQEGTLSIHEDGGLPVLKLRVFTEIGDFKTDETMILSIFRYSADQGYQKVCTQVYGNNDTSQLSQRETEIIKLCLEGLSSKMIADRLNLSVHTVKNHKRNCMEKTFTHSITELIHFCLISRWL